MEQLFQKNWMINMSQENTNLILKKDEIIYHEGDSVNFLYIVKKGKVLLFKELKGRIVPLNVSMEKEFIGEESIISKFTYLTSAIALEDSELIRINKSDISHVLGVCPQWVVNLVSLLSNRLNHAEDIIKEHQIIDPALFGDHDFTIEAEVKIKEAISKYVATNT